MLTGELRSQVDAIWNAFWSGSILNKTLTLGKLIENRVFAAGKDDKGRDYQDLRWSSFKNLVAPAVAFLASDEARFITGGSLAIHGGWTLTG